MHLYLDPMPRAPWLVVLLAVAALSVGCAPDEREDEETPAAATEEGEEETVISTVHGRWRLYPEPPTDVEPELTMSVTEESARETLPQLESSLSWRMAPVIENLEDLNQFSGVELGRLAALMGSEFQPVPGLPDDPRFDDPKFDPIRDAFTADCKREAGRYTNAFLSLTTANDLASMFSRPLFTVASDAYERNCLVPLDQVPLDVRRVIGVLGLETPRGTVFFCSATIVGERRLLTARHCFFDPASGAPLQSWTGLNGSLVTFYSVTTHAGTRSFSAKPLDPDEAAHEFAPFDDHLQLGVIEGPFEHVAEVGTESLTDLHIPLPAWVVGSNALLGDVTRAPSALTYVRGSGPQSCAVVGVTAAGCLYHSCQTGKTTSGGGILVQKPGGYGLVGVHKGAISDASPCEANAPSSLDLNLGAEFIQSDLLGV